MKLNEFFSSHAVFTLDELDRFLAERGTTNRLTRTSLLTYYQKSGRIIPLRRGLFAVVSSGALPESSAVDPFLLAGKISPDAVLAYHTALEFNGRAYSSFNRLTYLSEKHIEPFNFRSFEFRRIQVPRALRVQRKSTHGILEVDRQGIGIKVTNLERTFVDVMDRPDLSGSWEEIWRSLESIEFFDLDSVVEYVILLENATTAAKVGFFLEQHRDVLMVDDTHLKTLRNLRPHGRHYLESGNRSSGRLVSEWNLVVPREVFKRSWEETP